MVKPDYSIPVVLFLIFSVSLAHVCFSTENLSTYSFVYNYGNAKVWTFIETNKTLTVASNRSSTILITVYLESLGTNMGVFLNRITFKLGETQFEKTISPNITLHNDTRSWSCNITLSEDSIPFWTVGGTLAGTMTFELRYDIVDSTGDTWSYRVNENLPVRIVNVESTGPQWISFEMLFASILLIGIGSAAFIIWLKIHKYRKEQKRIHVHHDN